MKLHLTILALLLPHTLAVPNPNPADTCGPAIPRPCATDPSKTCYYKLCNRPITTSKAVPGDPSAGQGGASTDVGAGGGGADPVTETGGAPVTETGEAPATETGPTGGGGDPVKTTGGGGDPVKTTGGPRDPVKTASTSDDPGEPRATGTAPAPAVTGAVWAPRAVMESEEVQVWKEPAMYAAAVYCEPEVIETWTCSHCQSLPAATVLAQGGDGGLTPIWYAVQAPGRIVVAIRGTNVWNPNNLGNYLDDSQKMPDATCFTGRLDDVRVHAGFYGAFTRMAKDILEAVEPAVAGAGTTKDILVAGHSQGAAVGIMLAVYLQQHLDPSVVVTGRFFGTPRSGNPQWANLVDTTLGSRARHMTNYNDLVPHKPPLARIVGILPVRINYYRHSTGEVWINRKDGEETYWACEGTENSQCAMSLDPGGSIPGPEHAGPYVGVTMGC